jgi:hypothetical protein
MAYIKLLTGKTEIRKEGALDEKIKAFFKPL